MKAADIDNVDVLRAVEAGAYMPSMIQEALRPTYGEVPWKVMQVKIRKLDGRGLVEGCGCGCNSPVILADFRQPYRP